MKENYITNMCFIYGQGEDWENHTQISPNDLRKIVFEKNSKDTIYFLASFFFDKDRDAYLNLMEDICKNNIQVFKTDIAPEHVTDDEEWCNIYCKFITLRDLD